MNRAIPLQRQPRRYEHELLAPPGRHARRRFSLTWRSAGDAALVLLALAVLLLAVVAVQPPT